MKKLFLIGLLFLMSFLTVKAVEPTSPPLSIGEKELAMVATDNLLLTDQGVWHIDRVGYALMRCNTLNYTLTLRYVANCSWYPATFIGPMWGYTIYYLQDPVCDPTMTIYRSYYNQYVTFFASITIVYKNIYGGEYYDTEMVNCVYPPYTITNPIEYPD